jgi:uncharacterized heparinase superfamily protein
MRQLVRSAAAGAGRLVPRLGDRGIKKLLIAPQDIRTSDPTIAAEIYAGQIKLAGKLMETHGASPFSIACPSAVFEEALHGFDWLRHFRAADTTLIRDHSRALVADWIDGRALKTSIVARRVDITARRLISWLGQSPLLLEGVDAAFYARFIRSLSNDARQLKRLSRSLPSDETLLLVQIALTHFAVSASESDALIKTEALRLCSLLEEQVLSDGGHVSRSPAIVLSLLLDLLPLKLAFLWRRIQTPQPIVSAIDRMLPMLRMMRHSDGAVALFNGMGASRADILAAVQAQDDAMAPALLNAPYSGYQRLQHQKSILIADAGVPPKPPLAQRVHAAPGAFEFSVDGGRLVVNCGSPPSHRPEMKRISRLTSAHSTLVFDDANIGKFTRSRMMNTLIGDQYFAGASEVKAARATTEEGSILTIEHDGYARAYGLVHERRVALSSDGLMLEGEDILKPKSTMAARNFVLRFHLHPQVKASARPVSDVGQGAVNLILPNGALWIFEARDGAVSLEESIFLANPDGLRRCEQIVVTGDVVQTPMISWLFRKG